MKRTKESVSCEGKVQYAKYWQAEVKQRAWIATGAAGTCVYRCECCKQYHVGQKLERINHRRAMAERKENQRQRGLRLLRAWLDEMAEDMANGAPTSAAT